jgi:hypothetical protein
MNNILIVTGWCAHNEGHNNPNRAKRQNESEYLSEIWFKQFENFLNAKRFFVYKSICNVPCYGAAFMHENIVQSIRAMQPAKQLPYRHDWAASLLCGAAYAYANDMDMLFIEQDCLVFGLEKAIAWARELGSCVCYGFGKNCSWRAGWAENCLTYVSNDLLGRFIPCMHRIKDIPDAHPYLEEQFHTVLQNEFEDDVHYWPFGCGRLRPIPWDQEIFYAQHLTDAELDQFMQKIGDR